MQFSQFQIIDKKRIGHNKNVVSDENLKVVSGFEAQIGGEEIHK